MIGSVLLHYRILHPIGSGGMGEVYAAEDTRLNRRVALKLLPRDTADDPARLQRFRREAQAIASLRSELTTVEGNIDSLIKDLNASIQEADSFIASMEKDNA